MVTCPHPITSGVAFPLNPESVEFGADITGVNPGLILATFDNGNPAIIAQGNGTVSLGGGGACPDHTVQSGPSRWPGDPTLPFPLTLSLTRAGSRNREDRPSTAPGIIEVWQYKLAGFWRSI